MKVYLWSVGTERTMKSNPVRDIILDTPLNLKPIQCGRFNIERKVIKAGSDVTIFSPRNMLFMGVPALRVITSKDITVHTLKCGTDIMTSDSPQELNTQVISFKDAHGTVLVGGLGIGMAAVMIANMPRVKKVIVVEIESDIINLIDSQLPETKAPIEIVHDNLFEFINKRKADFDFGYFDIWAGTGENIWDRMVVPLRRLVWKRYGKRLIKCWLEGEMEGQIRRSIDSILNPVPGTEGGLMAYINSFKPYWTFWQAMQRKAIPEKRKDYYTKRFIDSYFKNIGSPQWEKTFRWDEYTYQGEKVMPKTSGDFLSTGNKILLEVEDRIANIRNEQTDSIRRMVNTKMAIEKLVKVYGYLSKIDTVLTLDEMKDRP